MTNLTHAYRTWYVYIYMYTSACMCISNMYHIYNTCTCPAAPDVHIYYVYIFVHVYIKYVSYIQYTYTSSGFRCLYPSSAPHDYIDTYTYICIHTYLIDIGTWGSLSLSLSSSEYGSRSLSLSLFLSCDTNFLHPRHHVDTHIHTREHTGTFWNTVHHTATQDLFYILINTTSGCGWSIKL